MPQAQVQLRPGGGPVPVPDVAGVRPVSVQMWQRAQRHIGLTCALSSWTGTPAAGCPLSRDSGAGAAAACTLRRRTRTFAGSAAVFQGAFSPHPHPRRGPALLPRSSRPPASPTASYGAAAKRRRTAAVSRTPCDAAAAAALAAAARSSGGIRRAAAERTALSAPAARLLPLAGWLRRGSDRSIDPPRKALRGAARGALSRAQEAEAVAVDDGGGQQVRDGGLVDPDLRAAALRPARCRTVPPA